MAGAERFLNEAQYAFNNVGPGGSRDDRRNAARAKSLARKIIRKFPTSTEAAEAHAILRRLGEEGFLPGIAEVHRHAGHDQSHRPPTGMSTRLDDTVSLDWAGLLSLILATPKTVLGIILAGLLLLFGMFGWLLLLPLVLLVLLTSPARALLQRKQRDDINAFVVRANAWIDRKIQAGTGLG